MKKIFCMFSLLLLTVFAFAQNVPSVGLKDGDVKNFVKNYNKIASDFDKQNIVLDLDSSSTTLAAKQLKEADKILEKNGISGPDRFKKVESISLCCAYIVTESELGKMGIKGDAAKPYLADMLSMLNANDLSVAKKYSSDIIKLFSSF